MGLGLFRSSQAHWFEVYVPRDQTVHAIEVLAETGGVQLELDPRQTTHFNVKGIKSLIREFDSFCGSHNLSLPLNNAIPAHLVGEPEEVAKSSVDYFRGWAARLFAIQDVLKLLQGEKADLSLLDACLTALESNASGIESFSHDTNFLFKGVYACPQHHPLNVSLKEIFSEKVSGETHDFFFLAGLPDRKLLVDHVVESSDCIQLDVPEWLPGDCDEQRAAIDLRMEDLDKEIAGHIATLKAYWRDAELKEALANIAVLRWFVDYSSQLTTRQKVCHVTGWTTASGPSVIRKTLEKAGIHALTRYPTPSVTATAPVTVLQSWWGKPFQIFATMPGQPGKGEVNPYVILPFVVPLLFGFMFPDIGHGFVLVLLGFVLSFRWPQLRFLVPCGISAMLFGIAFGEVFGLEDVIPVIWFRPLHEPVRIVVISLVLGSGLILMGLVFAAIEAAWQKRLIKWFMVDGAVLFLYISALITLFFPPAFPMIILVVVWYLIGSLVIHQDEGIAALPGIIGRILHSSFELVINSLSFIRLGAFALAHMAMSSAVFSMANLIESSTGHYLVLVMGHLFVIGVEALLVFVQTTRLILFEFFIRFLRADGRVFSPLTPPVKKPKI
ncbi:MAG: hypothetical protein DIZ78_13985 [endosymbiont of Escarpia spicata]|uniref:Uncharacterized protein n=1 Tax=endosymbiont of Escarpia spicata TaxID=2200908 RepID=A0A370DGW9_9GAMM|nr:MAG: hypothetical protein DIZ78_13985 [endosymbiont of Escarpia spicata]